MMAASNEIVARRLLKQAEWCKRLGSRLYWALLPQAAEDVRAVGMCSELVHDHHDDSPDSAVALRGPCQRNNLKCYPCTCHREPCTDAHHPTKTNDKCFRNILRCETRQGCEAPRSRSLAQPGEDLLEKPSARTHAQSAIQRASVPELSSSR